MADVLAARAVAERVDDDAAVADCVRETLADSRLEAADPRDLFRGVPAAADQVEAVSAHLGVSTTAATLLALSMLSIGCLDRVRLRIEEASGSWWETPLHVWTVSELRSGEGKSALLKAMGQPALGRFARQLAKTWESVEIADEDRRERAGRASKCDDEGERRAAKAALRAPPLLSPAPALEQTTAEEFGWRSLQSGFTWIVSAEGRDVLDSFVFGKETAAIGDLLNAYSGAEGKRATRKDTAAKNVPLFSEHHATVALLCQVGNLAPSNPAHRQRLADATSRGLLARFVVGRRAGEAPASPRVGLLAARAAWDALLERFLEVPEVQWPDDGSLPGLDQHPCAPRHPDGSFAGRHVEVAGEAARLLIEFQLAQKQAANNRAADDRDPAAALLARAGEVAIRVAGLLALARAGGMPALRAGVRVEPAEAERAIHFVEQIHIPHGLSLLEAATAGEVESLGQRVLLTMAKLNKKVTVAVFENSHARRWPEVRGRALRDKSSIEIVFGDLARRGLLVAEPSSRSTRFGLSPAGRAVVNAARRAAS